MINDPKWKRILKVGISLVFWTYDWSRRQLKGRVGMETPGTCVVLYYHEVPREERGALARQMDLLVRWAKPIRVDTSAPLSLRTHHVAIVFHDGFLSIVENALPVLAARRIPSAVFVPTGYLGQPPGWVRDPAKRDLLGRIVTADEIRSLDKELVVVASHSRSHANLLALSKPQAKEELVESKRQLEAVTGHPVELFGFPYGAYNRTLVEWSRKAGYRRVFTTLPRWAFADPKEYVTGSVNVSPRDWMLEFKLKLLGAYRWLPAAIFLKRKARHVVSKYLRLSDDHGAALHRDNVSKTEPSAFSPTQRVGTRMNPLRPFVEDDIPSVADLNWQVSRGGVGPSPPALKTYFRELFFNNPWAEKALPSWVYQNSDGRIIGFLGVVPRPMRMHGRTIQVGFGSNFVVHPAHRSSLAGLYLVRAFLAGKQDLALGDSSNNSSRKVWMGLGGSTALPYSLHWSRPLQPISYGLYALGRLRAAKNGSASRAVSYALKPLCRVADRLARSVPWNPFRQRASVFQEEELGVETLLACLKEFLSGEPLQPAYDKQSLSWLLNFMRQQKAYGKLRAVVLRDRSGGIGGWYICYMKRSGVCEVVQVGARTGSIGEVLDHLFCDALNQGALAVQGRFDPRYVQELTDKYCFFYRRGGWMLAHSHHPELLQLIQSAEALLTRLDGEWCMSFGEPEGDNFSVSDLSESCEVEGADGR